MNEKYRASRQTLGQDEKHHYQVTEYSNDLMLTVDPCGQITYLSPAAVRTMGYTPAEAGNRILTEWIHPDDRNQAAKALERVIEYPEAQVAMEVQFPRCH